jgi:predicted RNase H-like nuclease (RuvC/YqgF family)
MKAGTETRMDRKKLVVDLQQMDLLEQKIVRATELIRALRRERDASQAKIAALEGELARARDQAAASEEERRGFQDMAEQIETLREERQAIRGRVNRMLEVISGLDDLGVEAGRDN